MSRFTKNLMIVCMIVLLGFFVWAFIQNQSQKSCFIEVAKINCEEKGLNYSSSDSWTFDSYDCINGENKLYGYGFSQEEVNKCVGAENNARE